MAYFTNPRSEEELKEQYRKLLIQYDYRNPKNEKLIADIRKEYEQKLKQIKYDSGYRTTAQKIKEGVTGYIAQQSAEYEQEQARKKTLRDKPYTKQDLSNLIEEQKRFVIARVNKILVAQNTEYEDLKVAILNAKRGKDIYDVYSRNDLITFAPQILETINVERNGVRDAECNEFVEMFIMKEKMEYCVLALSGNNEKQMEIMLSQVEDQLGNYVKQIFQQYEKKVVDPIVEMKAMQEAKRIAKNKKSDESTFKFLRVLSYIPGIIAIMIGLIAIFEGGIVIIAIGVGWIFFARFLTTTNTRMRQRKKRIRTEEEQYITDKSISIIARFLSNLFR